MGFDIYSSVRTPNPLDEMKDENYSEWEQVEELLGNYAHFTITAWPKLIQMARTYGWQPTVINTYEMGYSVTAEEAAALGEALIKALDDIPDTTADGRVWSG
jgi:glutamine phosphoribosylpyrophosphate amidotransferase